MESHTRAFINMRRETTNDKKRNKKTNTPPQSLLSFSSSSSSSFMERQRSFVNSFTTVGMCMSPCVLLWILLIGAKLVGALDWTWISVFVPFYGVMLVWIFFVILDARQLRRQVASTFAWILVWLLVAGSTWMIVSNLQTEEKNSWLLAVGPLAIALAVFATFEVTTCVGISRGEGDDWAPRSRFRSNNVFLDRSNAPHVFVWLMAEVSMLVFLATFAHKLDNAPRGLHWGLVFVPLWVSFAFFLAIVTVAAVTREKKSASDGSAYCNLVSLLSLLVLWLTLLLFSILLNVKLAFPDTLEVFAVIAPLLAAIVVLGGSMFCARDRFRAESEAALSEGATDLASFGHDGTEFDP